MDFRISDLKNFVLVATCRTMRDGAEKLQITQPALSESIKRLEKDLGSILFYRSRSGISLTPEGKEAYKKALSAMAVLDSIPRSESSEGDRTFTIGCHATVASYFLPQFFEAFKGDKNYRFQFRHDLSRVIQVEIQQGRVDVGVVVNPIPSPDLVIRTIANDEVCIWQNKKAKMNLNRVFCDLNLNQSHSILRKWKNNSVEAVATGSLELIVRLASVGVGYGIAPKRIVQLIDPVNLEEVPLSPRHRDTFSLVYRPEFGKNIQERRVLDCLKQSFVSE